ncbi:hypothetical protein BS47DRAFT_1367413 [Hydnum rufescens UP504]|uniref:Uncharacterized protein n=1 Tax=Hydnum rufescens UP504 TaxID=1448309 RepID=A0A9P6AIX9_9AGAM|nr:hypothetical protein BS47DRAFT_1367413 [Hydnum rufescens UP504]
MTHQSIKYSHNPIIPVHMVPPSPGSPSPNSLSPNPPSPIAHCPTIVPILIDSESEEEEFPTNLESFHCSNTADSTCLGSPISPPPHAPPTIKLLQTEETSGILSPSLNDEILAQQEENCDDVGDVNTSPLSKGGSSFNTTTAWSQTSLIAAKAAGKDEDLTAKIHLHLQSKGKFIAAIDIPKENHQPGNSIMVDENIIAYHQNTFLPLWDRLLPLLRVWDREGQEIMVEGAGQRTMIWTHNESTFYAHDWHKVHWVHESKTPKPIQKGEGPSLMVSNFTSPDYSWLCSPNGLDAACVLFKAGKNCEGYFTNDGILEQVTHAMDILDKYYPYDDHVLAFDNATIHKKCLDDTLSASKMLKSIPNKPHNFLVDVVMHDATGKTIQDGSRNVMKEK